MQRRTYSEDHGSINDAAHRGHSLQDRRQRLIHFPRVANIASTNFYVDAFCPKFVKRLLGLLTSTASGNEYQMACSFLGHPLSNIESNSSCSTSDNVGSMGRKDILGFACWVNL